MGEGLVIAGVFSRVVGYAIDTAFLGTLYFILLAALGAYDGGRLSTGYIAVNILLLAVEAIYFVGLWRSGWHATLGMRLMGLRVLRAIDGGTLTLNSAVIRWLAVLGIPTILGFIPVFGALAQLLWVVALLLTTAMQPLRQGLHDRWAGSVVVQPAPGGSGAAVVGCLVLIALIFILPIVLLIMLGGQIQDLLSTVGTSI